MLLRAAIAAVTMTVICCAAGAEVFVGPQAPERGLGIVQNPSFDRGGLSYADHWRPLPGAFRMHRTQREDTRNSLFLQLREDGDGGVVQTVILPPRRALSLRLLATCHADEECAAVATLTRCADGVVLAEVVVDGIERGVLAQGFETGPGGPAELMLRVVGSADGRALIDRVTIAPPVPARHARAPDYSCPDLLLACGEALRVDAGFRPRLLPQAARMLQEAIEDLAGARTTAVGATVTVSVDTPEATDWPARESYRLTVCESGVTINAPAEEGAFRAMMTLIDLIRAEPGGAVRILGVDLHDRPALPWRLAVGHVADPNTARKMARLKLNMALVDARRDDAASVATQLRSLAIEPVLTIGASDADDLTGAMRDALRRLEARFLLVTEPSPAVTAFAREHAERVAVMAPAGDSDPEAWPEEIVALVAADGDEEPLRRRFGAGVRYVLGDLEPSAGAAVAPALERMAAGDRCLGAVIGLAGPDARSTQELADLAWRGLPAGE